MVMNMRIRILALLTILIVILAACGGGGSAEPTQTRIPPTDRPEVQSAEATPTEEVTEAATAEAESIATDTAEATATADAAEAIETAEPSAEETTASDAAQTEIADATPAVEVTTDATPEMTEAVEATATTVDATEVAAAQPVTIWEYISTNPDFSTLVTAVEAIGLVDTLNTTDGITLFAPTNAAFEALPAGTLDELLADAAALQTVLTYHGLPFEVRTNVLEMAGFVRTLQGEEIAVSVEDGAILLNGTARITTANVNATNGVVHIIDSVLLPPSMQPEATATPESDATAEATAAIEPTADATADATVEATSEAESTPEATPVVEATPEATPIIEGTPEGTPEPVINTILGVTGADPNFSTFVQAVETAGLTDALSGEGPFIVFVPTNAAFEGVPASLLLDDEALSAILLYHVAEGDAETELDGALTTLQGSALMLSTGVSLMGITVNNIPVIDALQVDNGVIYVIDQVLTPPSGE